MSAVEIYREYSNGGASSDGVRTAAFSVAATTGEVIAAPGAGYRIVVIDGFSMPNTGGTETWLTDATALTGTMAAGVSAPKRLGLWVCDEDEPLNLTAVTATISGWVTYIVERV